MLSLIRNEREWTPMISSEAASCDRHPPQVNPHCSGSTPRLQACLAILGLSLVLWPVRAGAQSSVQWTTNYYPVTGTTLSEVRQSIRRNRPWKDRFEHDAMTNWRVKWEFTTGPTATGCQCRSFRTQTTIVVSMPGWITSTNASDTARQLWRQYVTALGRHEAGHAELALAAAAELHKRIQGLSEAPDCRTLEKQIGDLCQSVIEDHRKRDRAYDEKTHHGADQGAVLPSRGRRSR